MTGRYQRGAHSRQVACVALAAAFLMIVGCDNLSPSERELAHTDAEVFEAVARSELVVPIDDSSRLPRFLRIDSRPVDNTALLPPQSTASPEFVLESDSVLPSSAAINRIGQDRRAILERLGIEEGGPFFFPGCEGVRTGEAAPAPGATSSRAGCPSQWRRYVTIGLPRRGVGLIPEKVRRTEPRSFDSGEVWTVLVTETSIGSGGQDWKQYAWVLTRDPDRAGLGLAARFLLSWAE
ncbi:MAG TPA: hypothetical protein VK481_13840 [Gemmatimonadaceae bacterium]|nr:hypothetical protein [Gemmatimonadaceae bacterium]